MCTGTFCHVEHLWSSTWSLCEKFVRMLRSLCTFISVCVLFIMPPSNGFEAYMFLPCVSVCPSKLLSIWISFCRDNWWTTDQKHLKIRYRTKYLKMKSYFFKVVWFNIYTKACFLHIFVKERDIDLKIGMYVNWCATNFLAKFAIFTKLQILSNFSKNCFFPKIGLEKTFCYIITNESL